MSNECSRLFLCKESNLNNADNFRNLILHFCRIYRILPRAVKNLISIVRNYRAAFSYTLAQNAGCTKCIKSFFNTASGTSDNLDWKRRWKGNN